MRLLDIKRYINIAYENFDPKFSTSGSYYYLDNILQTKKGYKSLARFRYFRTFTIKNRYIYPNNRKFKRPF